MSAIETYLQYIASKVWARDVRTAIVNAIRQCYDDVHNPTLNTEALQAALQAKIDAGQMAALIIGDRTITAAKLALGVIPTPDTTLSQSGVPADAKAAGDAISTLQDDLDALSSQIGGFTWVTGQYIPTNIDPVDISNIQANTTWKYMLVEVTPGEQYTLTHVSSGNATRAWCITDASGNVLDVADSTTDYAEQVITIPELGAYLIIHAYASTENANITGATIKTKINELEAELNSAKDSLEAEIEETKELIGDSTPTITIPYDFYDAVLALLENAYYRTGSNDAALNKLKTAASLYVYDGAVYLSKYYVGIDPIQSCRTLIG